MKGEVEKNGFRWEELFSPIISEPKFSKLEGAMH